VTTDVRASAAGSSTPATPPTGGRRPSGRGWLVAALVVAVVLLVGSIAGTIAGSGSGGVSTSTGSSWSRAGGGMMGGRVSTRVPALPGTTVQVTALDMGAMMGGRAGMRLAVDRTTVPAGTVSLVLGNAGFRTHELVVLPLAAGQQAGTRAVGSDRKVDETGSLGEASQTGGSGAGEGIQPGAAGWTTLDLPAGRYELICNLPGHYAAGMFAELTVS
jgi:uncharacterized cupredoxin-like copper-binding protein